MASETHRDIRPDARLTLVTLGDVALRAEADGAERDQPSTVFEIGKPLAVVTYLACAPDRAVTREHLIDLLWGDVEPDAAKHALRQTLWYLRKRLGQRPLVSGGDTLTLVGQLDCDRDVFLAAAERGDVEAVVQLYAGDFFPGFAAPGGAEFERWADAERLRLRSVFWRSAEVLVRRWLSAARPREAQALARRVRDTDLLREAGWRLLFETIIAGSDVVSSALELDAFERLCQAEGIIPERATQALVRAMRQGPLPNAPLVDASTTLVAELVGREREFATIVDAWDVARQGRARHVHVVAPAGLGKTRLISDAHARLRASRARTVFVRATLGMRDIPYGLAGELALVLCALPGATGISPGSARALVALNPAVSSSFPSIASEPRPVTPNDATHGMVSALRELITVLAEEQPIAVFVDDLQWADAVSRQMLVGIAATLHSARALIVTASRPMVDVVQSSESSETIQLAPLTKEAVVALVASLAALPAQPWADGLPMELWHATAGSPLLILESLQLVSEQGLLERANGEWAASDPQRLLAALQAGGALRHRVERLERLDRWLLTLLAVGGAPLAIDVIATAAERTEDETLAQLVALEQRGIVVRQSAVWMPAHDEIAAMAVELASDGAVRAAARALGRALVTARPSDLRTLRHAGALLDRAGDGEGLTLAFSLFARVTRDAGDRRPNVALARDFAGQRPAVVSRALARSLPLMHRLGLYSTRRQVAAASALVMLPVTAAVVRATLLGRAEPAPEEILVVGTIDTTSTARLYEYPIRSAALPVGGRIQPFSRGTNTWTFAATREYSHFVARPDGASWLVERVSKDSGGIDIWEVGRDGERRLTATPGDDQAGAWSPDGRSVAYVTGRWNLKSHYDLAILDTRTGSVRALTRTANSDLGPSWSPDGSRIAFVRNRWDGQPGDSCVIDFDGSHERCISVPGAAVVPQQAWTDIDHVLVHVSRRGQPNVIGRLQLSTGTLDTIAVSGNVFRASPDGRWIACDCPQPGVAPNTVIVFPADAPSRAAELELPRANNETLAIAWVPPSFARRYADSVAIDAGNGSPNVSVPHQLSAVARSPAGTTVSAGAVRWRSLDTTVAVIDSFGVLVGRRPGTATIAVSLGGWRSTRRHIDVVEPEVRDLLHETWDNAFEPSWRSFGVPAPRIDTAFDGTRGMMNNGDGSQSSGVYTRQSFETAHGLAIDTRISAPINDMQWQYLNVALNAGLDSASLLRWDERTGVLPILNADYCSIGFPGGAEGKAFGDTLGVGWTGSETQIRAPETFANGGWFSIRIQLFPDGRCGFAVNGAPIGISSRKAISSDRVRLLVHGNSVGTTVLAGEVTVRSGVVPDIDWSKATSTPAFTSR